MSPKYPSTILIIDDDPIIVDVLKLTLDGDCELMSSTSGLGGLAIAQRELPDLILLDVNMPDISGHALCRKLKADTETRSIPIIFITAMQSSEDEVIGFEVGAVDYITKPIVPTIVRARVATHLELKRQRDYLQALSATDGLTGIANRRLFDSHLSREWRRGARAGSAVSLIMLDLDCFKSYNDTYGHIAGDECLQDIARVLGETPHRGGDLVARYGGEEFAVVLPDTPFEAAQRLAEKCRAGVESLKIPHATSKISEIVTVSAGAATTVPDHRSVATSLVEVADRMLYTVKHNGGNAVCAENVCSDVEASGVEVAKAS